MNAERLREYVQAACEAAERGGQVLAQWQQRVNVREKGRCDLVTEADLASQEAIREVLLGRYPDHAFLGEEDSQQGGASHGGLPEELTQRPIWIVDPLDGTTNYVHGVPLYAVSVALAVEGVVLAGVVYDPCRREMFLAARGLGAWLDGRQLQTSDTPALEQALVSTGFPPDLRGKEYVLEGWRRLALKARSLRRTGSTALNLAYVAAGRNDAFWTHHAFAWDCAAGVVLVEEAGGRASYLDGTQYRLERSEIVCSNGPLHPLMLAELHDLAPLAEGTRNR